MTESPLDGEYRETAERITEDYKAMVDSGYVFDEGDINLARSATDSESQQKQRWAEDNVLVALREFALTDEEG